jgi:hypothetical protein
MSQHPPAGGMTYGVLMPLRYYVICYSIPLHLKKMVTSRLNTHHSQFTIAIVKLKKGSGWEFMKNNEQ